jgi:hypothetical protein
MRRVTTFAIGTIAIVALGAPAFWVLKSQGGQDGPTALTNPDFPTGGILYDQYDNAATEPPINIGSQDFEATFDALDDQAADDFVIPVPPPNITIFITGVRVMGEYSDGGGPASSFNVYFYSNGPDTCPGR